MVDKNQNINQDNLKSKIERLVIIGFVIGGILIGLMLTFVALNAFSRQEIKLFMYITLMILPVLVIILAVIRAKVIRYKSMLRQL